MRVDHGHLILHDGIGPARREARLSRVGHGLRRLVVIGADGCISLAALEWLADQDAAFVMLDRDGTVLATTGPVRPSDVRLRRAQVLALGNGVGLEICRTLIDAKLQGQERVARERLNHPAAAQEIAAFREKLPNADSFEALRWLEAYAAARTSPRGTMSRSNGQRQICDESQTIGARQEAGDHRYPEDHV